MIPKDVIEDIRNRLDLVQIVGQVTPLKRSGSNHVACCPFHDEKTPSFQVSSAKQLYHCFGCGVGGNTYHFLMNYHHFTFPEALEWGAKEVGVDLAPYQKTHLHNEQDDYSQAILRYAQKKYHQVLTSHALGKTALSVLTQRDVTPEMIETFGLGFAPDGWENMASALKRDKKSLSDAVKVGVIQLRKKQKDSYYDVFRNRIMIPIYDAKGEMIGFGGRAMGDDKPKYLNSPQTKWFDKSRTLYGLHMAEQAMRRSKKVYVVEGYFDQIVLWQAGIKNVVATLGTATTPDHARVLRRYVDEVILVFDGDEAGKQASKKAARSLLPMGISARVMVMPKGEDPDSWVRVHGAEAFDQYPKHLLMDYLIDAFYTNVTSIDKKTSFLEDVVDWVVHADNAYVAQALKDEFCQKMGLDPSIFTKARPISKPKPTSEGVQQPITPTSHIEEVMLLVLYAQHEAFRAQCDLEDLLSMLSSPDLTDIARSCMKDDLLAQNPMKWFDHWAKEDYRSLLSGAMLEIQTDWSNDQLRKAWVDCFRKTADRKLAFLQKQIEIAQSRGQDDQVIELTQAKYALKKRAVDSVA